MTRSTVRRRLSLGVGGLLTLTACTPRQLEAWVAWHAQDPAAAIAHAEALDDTEIVEPSVSWSVNWDAVARCESGGDWSHPPVSNSSGTYSGGLMIGHRWWPLYGGREFATHPYQASKAAQITVAERIVDDVGFDRGWQCDAW